MLRFRNTACSTKVLCSLNPVPCRSAVADFLTDTLSAIPDASTGARTGFGMDWPAVLRMMLKQKQCTECVQHQRLALSLCTICVGLIIRMAGTAVKVESDVTRSARNVLLEALSSDCEHSDRQSACVLKVLRSASFQVVGLSSDQVRTLQRGTAGIMLSNHVRLKRLLGGGDGAFGLTQGVTHNSHAGFNLPSKAGNACIGTAVGAAAEHSRWHRKSRRLGAAGTLLERCQE